MASGMSRVTRKKKIRSYAGFSTGAAKYMIVPLTENAVEYARDKCPVDTGELRDSIHGDVMGLVGMLKAQGKMLIDSNGRSISQAVVVEFGTPRSPAKPFMRPGMSKAKRELKKHWRTGLKEAEREQSTGA